VCFPKVMLGKVIELAKSQVQADEKVARDIDLGKPFTEASKEHRASIVKLEDLRGS
jgi:hypothetical protein